MLTHCFFFFQFFFEIKCIVIHKTLTNEPFEGTYGNIAIKDIWFILFHGIEGSQLESCEWILRIDDAVRLKELKEAKATIKVFIQKWSVENCCLGWEQGKFKDDEPIWSVTKEITVTQEPEVFKFDCQLSSLFMTGVYAFCITLQRKS